MNDKLQPILVIVATVGMIIFNYFAATGFAGGVATNVPSDKYPTHITPAGYAFAIWSLIYLGCLVFSIYQALPKQLERFRPLRRIYIVSCVANCAWLYFWSQEMIVICLGVILILLGTLAFINIKLQRTESYSEYWLVKFPFGIYFGWVTAATILNATIALVYLGVKVSDSTANLLGAGLLLIAAVLGVIMRIKLTNYFYPLAIAWALTAIALKQSGQTLIVATAAFGVIACLITALSFVMNMPSSADKTALIWDLGFGIWDFMNNGKICVSVCAATADALLEQIKRAEVLADVIEIRFDFLNHLQFKKFLFDFKNLKQNFLATFRPKEQGGKRELGLSDRRKFWELISTYPNVMFSDIEPDLQKKFTRLRVNSRIASFHNFSNSNNNLKSIFDELEDTNSDIIKIAVQADDITDTIPIWKLLQKAKSEKQQIIPIAMGESGKWTRILGLAHGAFMTYASLDAGNETAPGQVSAKDLIEVYRARELDETTEVYGILGSNTSVSMSPYIHNAAFKFHGLNSVFVPLQVHNLDEFMRRMVKVESREIELNFKGFSVTIPHKQSIIKHLDFLDETAAKIGAVNTVKIVDGKLHGYNTDAQGFIEPLLNSYGALTGAKVALLGAGGAARACVHALKTAGADVTIFARDIAKAASLANDLQVELKELPKTKNQKPKTNFSDFDILVNATPLGMKGKAEGETPATAEQLKGLQLVYDLVYIPFQTALMTEADAAEVPKIGGLAMLIAQAIEQQKIWTGLDAPIREMSQAALRRLS